MDTMGRVHELIEERHMSLYKLAKLCDIPYSTLKNTIKRNGQLTVDTIERICVGLEIPMYEFFVDETSRPRPQARKLSQNEPESICRGSR